MVMYVNIPYFPYIALAFGLIIGSFYNVCVHRYLTKESIVFPGSKCPKCEHKLSWWENIPLISYIILGGKCSSCKEPIRLRYPAVELISGLWAFALAMKFGCSLVFALYMVIGGILIVASFIDFDSFILPDVLTLPGAVIAFAGAYFILFPAQGYPTLKDSLLGAVIGAGMFLFLQQLFKKLKGIDGLGTGDIKLMLLIGSLLGWQGLPVTILVAALSALLASVYYLVRPGAQALRTMIPFGPFLSLGCMLYVLYGELYWKYFAGR